MTILQILAGIFLTSLMVVKFYINKIATNLGYTPKQMSFVTSVYMITGSLLSLPFLYAPLIAPVIANSPNILVPILGSVLKGVVLYFCIKLIAQVGKVSTSSTSFALTAALPFGGFFNTLIFAEALSESQLLAMSVMGATAIIYFFKGHIKTLTTQNKVAFIALVATAFCNMIIDKFVISNSNWYFHLLISNLTWFLICSPQLLSQAREKIKVIYKPIIIAQGSVYLITEFSILFLMQSSILGVTITFLFMRLTTPIIMTMSALLWKEGKIRDQATFGLIAFACALLVIFKPF
jgi:hypothetical protein